MSTGTKDTPHESAKNLAIKTFVLSTALSAILNFNSGLEVIVTTGFYTLILCVFMYFVIKFVKNKSANVQAEINRMQKESDIITERLNEMIKSGDIPNFPSNRSLSNIDWDVDKELKALGLLPLAEVVNQSEESFGEYMDEPLFEWVEIKDPITQEISKFTFYSILPSGDPTELPEEDGKVFALLGKTIYIKQ